MSKIENLKSKIQNQPKLSAISHQLSANDNRQSSIVNRQSSIVWVWLFYLVMTVLLTWPMILNFSSAVPSGSIEDRFQNFWNFWWLGRALSNFQNPFETNVLFYPYYTGGANPTVPLYLHTLQLLNCLVVLPLTATLGIAAAYNGLILLAFSLSGLGAFLLARQLTKNFAAALLAGLVYTFSASHFGSVRTSVTNIMSIEWLPFYAWALFVWQERRTWRWVLIAAAFLAACAYTDWYNTLYLLFFTAFFFVWTSWPRHWLKELPGIAGAVGGGLVLGAPAFLGAFATLNSPIFAAQLDPNRDLRASKYLLNLINPLQTDGAIFWTGLLVGVGLLLFGKTWRRRGLFWLAFFLVCYLLALGPRLQLEDTDGKNPTNIPLPYALLKLVPGASVMRAPERFDTPGQLGLALLLALGLVVIAEKVVVPQRAVPQFFTSVARLNFVLLLVIATPYLILVNPAPLKMTEVAPSSFVSALPKGDYSIMELPITRHYNFDHERMLNQTYHRRPIMGGYLARPVFDPYRTPDSPFRYLADQTYVYGTPEREIFPAQYSYALVDNLARLYNFRYIALYKNDYRYDRERQGIKQLLEGRLGADAKVMEDNGYALYKVPDNLWRTAVSPALWLGDGWYDVEQNAEGLYRWTRQQASFYIAVSQPTRIKLSMLVRAFGGDRPARLVANGKTVYESRLTPAPTTVEFEFDAQPGVNSLMLESLTPAQTGQETGLAPDNRPLAFLVANLKLSY